MLLIAVFAGCKNVEEIPADLDGVLHYLWQSLDDGTPAELAEGVVNLDRALDAKSLTEATDGSLSRLTKAEVEPLGVVDRDPADAAGIFLGNVVHCPLPEVVEIVTWPAQDELYPGVYDSYDRTYHGDIGAFLAGDPDELRWDLDYAAAVLGASYTGRTEALLRRVDGSAYEDGEAPFDEAYLVRFFAPEPADFEEGSSNTFDQDYQFEVYWSRRPAETLHAYAMWREADWGAGFTSEHESVQRLLLNGMADWDKDTDKICAEGGP
jgi:hypothetical protein